MEHWEGWNIGRGGALGGMEHLGWLFPSYEVCVCVVCVCQCVCVSVSVHVGGTIDHR